MIARSDSLGHVEGHGISAKSESISVLFSPIIARLIFSPVSLHLILFSAPPDSISIQSVGGLAIRPGGLLTVTEDVISQVTSLVLIDPREPKWQILMLSNLVFHQVECVTRFSNPSPFISWSLGGRRLPSTSQTNSTEPGTNKWRYRIQSNQQSI